MADETMFARLQQRLVDEAKRQCDLPSFHGPYWASEPNEFNSTMYLHGTFDMAAIVRALLAELRKACDENGMNVIGSPSDFLDTIDAILAEGDTHG